MAKILHISPHLSTGGLPEFLYLILKKTDHLYENHCLEYKNLSDEYNVQKNKIIELLDEKFYRQVPIQHLLDGIKPDIVYLHELPEYFLSEHDACVIYCDDRDYKIVETSHDSNFDTKNKKYLPDTFALISDYQESVFENLEVPITRIETDFEPKDVNRKRACETLGLDPEKEHVVNVGLLTERKNQKEFLYYAEKLADPNRVFHLVGSMASNFENYWKPLLDKYSSYENIIFWGQRYDVDLFYQISDLFLFTSKPKEGDKETKPLVIREALEYGNKVFMHNQDNYFGYYDDKVSYLTESLESNISSISSFLSEKKQAKAIDIDVTFDETNYRFDVVSKLFHKFEVSIKELDTGHYIYAFIFDCKIDNNIFWTVPMDKEVFKAFDNRGLSSGLGIEIRYGGSIILEKDFPFENKVVNKKSYTPVATDYKTSSWVNYSQFFTQNLYSYIPDGIKTCIDIGANIGIASNFFLNKGAERVYAVEADSRSYDFLKKTYGQDPRFTLINKACSYSVDDILFSENINSTISNVFDIDDSSVLKETINLERIFHDYNIERVGIIKIDIEGGEYEIFRNAKQETIDKADNFLIEAHALNREKLGYIMDKLGNFNVDIRYDDDYDKKVLSQEELDSKLEMGLNFSMFATRK